jgi:hypothetical protein
MSFPSSGTSGNPITLSVYGSGNKPIFTGRDAIPGWNTPGNWTNHSGNIWQIACNPNPMRIWLSGAEYAPFDVLASLTSRFRWYWSGNVLSIYSTGNPATTYSSVEGAYISIFNVLTFSNHPNITVRNLNVQGGCVAIDLEGSNNTIFDSCNIAGNTGAVGMYISAHSDAGIIRYCNIDRQDTAYGATNNDNLVGGEDLITLLSGNAWQIHHNLFKNAGHCALNIFNAGHAGNRSNYNMVYNNEFTAPNRDYGAAFAIQTDSAGKASHNQFLYNYIHNVPGSSHVMGDHNLIAYNVIDTMVEKRVIVPPWHGVNNGPCGIAIDLPSFWYSDSNTIANNTIMNCDDEGINVAASTGGYSSPHNLIYNNLIYRTGLNPSTVPGWSWLSNIAMLIIGSAPSMTYENNLFYNSGTSTPIIYRGGSGSNISVATFNGEGSDVTAANITGDPLLNSDRTLQLNSPCINAGIDLGFTRDYAGNPIVGLPDIGAFEYHASASRRHRANKTNAIPEGKWLPRP